MEKEKNHLNNDLSQVSLENSLKGKLKHYCNSLLWVWVSEKKIRKKWFETEKKNEEQIQCILKLATA